MAGETSVDGPTRVRRAIVAYRRVQIQAFVSEAPDAAIESARWDVLLEMLAGYLDPTNWVDGRPVAAIGQEHALKICELIQKTRIGESVLGLVVRQGRGRRQLSETKAAQSELVSYIWACRGKLPGGGRDEREDRAAIARQLNDPDPVGTVASASGMSEQQVYNLVSKLGDTAVDPCSKYLSISKPDARAELIRNSMNAASDVWRSLKSSDARARVLEKAAKRRKLDKGASMPPGHKPTRRLH